MTLPLLSEKSQETLGKAAVNRWKMEMLTGLLGYRALQRHQAETEKNQAAENAHVRKTLWGSTVGESTGEDMGHTILGDVNHPPPVIYPPQNNWLAPILAATLAAGGAYLYATGKAQPEAPELQFETESVSVGLGRIEDYQ